MHGNIASKNLHVHFIECTSVSDLDAQLNNWLGQADVRVLDMQYGTASAAGRQMYYSVMIIYRSELPPQVNE